MTTLDEAGKTHRIKVRGLQNKRPAISPFIKDSINPRGFVRICYMEVIYMYIIPTSIILAFNPTNVVRKKNTVK